MSGEPSSSIKFILFYLGTAIEPKLPAWITMARFGVHIKMMREAGKMGGPDNAKWPFIEVLIDYPFWSLWHKFMILRRNIRTVFRR